jgi:hypothetical protein
VGLLYKVSKGCEAFRISLYVDDATIFIKPSEKDLKVTNTILSIFAEANVLITNMDKTEFYPIRCDQTSLDFLTQNNHALSTFPVI